MSNEMDISVMSALVEAVQHNCHISDARHAGDYTLCVYLLKMREMYRWEQQESFQTTLTTDDVGDWLTQREGLWDEVEEDDYSPLPIGEQSFDAFDNDAANALLKQHRLVYNAGYGLRCRPHFFLAELDDQLTHDGFDIRVSGRELARDMAAPPAMTQGKVIYIRMESLRRVLWEKVEEWTMSPLDNPMGRCIGYYDFESDNEKALDQMVAAEFPYVIKHEIGEAKAGQILGSDWLDLVSLLASTKAEIMLRAIRDLYADSLMVLDELIAQGEARNIHFYFGNLSAMRKLLAPALVAGYEQWYVLEDMALLKSTVEKMPSFYEALCAECIELYRVNQGTDSLAERIEQLIESRTLS